MWISFFLWLSGARVKSEELGECPAGSGTNRLEPHAAYRAHHPDHHLGTAAPGIGYRSWSGHAAAAGIDCDASDLLPADARLAEEPSAAGG